LPILVRQAVSSVPDIADRVIRPCRNQMEGVQARRMSLTSSKTAPSGTATGGGQRVTGNPTPTVVGKANLPPMRMKPFRPSELSSPQKGNSRFNVLWRDHLATAVPFRRPGSCRRTDAPGPDRHDLSIATGRSVRGRMTIQDKTAPTDSPRPRSTAVEGRLCGSRHGDDREE